MRLPTEEKTSEENIMTETTTPTTQTSSTPSSNGKPAKAVFLSAEEAMKAQPAPAADGKVRSLYRVAIPAEAAGLQVNDVVLLADGKQVTDEDSLNERLAAVPTGGSIRLTILRRGERREITLKPAH